LMFANVFTKWIQIRASHRFQNISCLKSLFEKVYKKIWLLKSPLQRLNWFWKLFQKSFEKQKPFKGLDFINSI
jgi:hypothetical protein